MENQPDHPLTEEISPTPAEPPSTAGRTRRRLVVPLLGVAVVAVVVGGVLLNGDDDEPADGASEPVAVSTTLQDDGVRFGAEGPVVEVFVDYKCTHCADLDLVIGPTLRTMVEDGEAQLLLRPVKFLSGASARAAGGLRCAADTDHALDLHETLLANLDRDLGVPELTTLAESVGIEGSEFAECLADRSTRAWVNGVTASVTDDAINSIPLVRIRGYSLTDAELESGPAFRAAVSDRA